MRPVPRLWGIFTLFLFLLGPADVARAEEVDPTLLDACPGYNATNVKVDGPKLTAKLVLAGTPCKVFGNDIKALDLTVVYETGEPSSRHMAQEWRLSDGCSFSPASRWTRTQHPRNAHPPQDNRRVERALRSSRVRLPAARGRPKDARGRGPNPFHIQRCTVRVQYLANTHGGRALHDRGSPPHL